MSSASLNPNESTSDPKSDEKYREWVLQPQSEYRFELAPNTSIGIKVRAFFYPRPTLNRRVQLVNGYAECFGNELATRIVYLFGGECKAAIYTHSGCKIEISVGSISVYRPWPYHFSLLTSMANPLQNIPRKRQPWATIGLRAYCSSRCVSWH